MLDFTSAEADTIAQALATLCACVASDTLFASMFMS